MDEYITIALPKGKLFDKSVRLLSKVGYSAENVTEDSRKLVISNEETKVRFIIAKTVDVPTYVEYGAADIGIIGKDVLLEQDKDVVELLDLGFGRCRLMKLNGSIELGPIVGLSEMIVDIVETGRTLKENKLAEVDSIFTATARLIANRASFKLKFARLHKLVEDLRIVLNEEDK